LGAADHVPGGCGIHVHTGTSCEAADDVGGHYYSARLFRDPWAPVKYAAEADGSSTEHGIEVATGLSNSDVTGRVMVVHELASGARVACGLIRAGLPRDPQLTCAGFGPPKENTDISGNLIDKVWAASADRCCELCDVRAECEGYVFHLDQCYLKKDLGAESSKQLAVARVKTPPTCEGYAPPMVGVDISGTLLAKIQSSTPAWCCTLCDAFEGCEAYVFHLDQCYLKKDLHLAVVTLKPLAITRLRFHV